LALRRRSIPGRASATGTAATALEFEPVKGVDAETLAPKVMTTTLSINESKKVH
jgi:hypothetical protein